MVNITKEGRELMDEKDRRVELLKDDFTARFIEMDNIVRVKGVLMNPQDFLIMEDDYRFALGKIGQRPEPREGAILTFMDVKIYKSHDVDRGDIKFIV